MPRVTVEFMEGRTVDQKRKLVKAITDAICTSLELTPERVTIRLVDVKKENSAKGGVLRIDEQVNPDALVLMPGKLRKRLCYGLTPLIRDRLVEGRTGACESRLRILGCSGSPEQPRVKRRCYADQAGRTRSLADERLELEPRRRLSKQVCLVARKLCCELTYRRASDVLKDQLGVRIEAQTGHGLAQELGQEIESGKHELVEAVLEARVVPEPGKRRSAFLCVEADGVHIRLQREGKRKGAEVKLGVAYDGWHTRSGRTEVANKLVYGYLGSGTDFWDRFGLQVNSQWDLSATSRIVVGGDGAEWVEQGTSMFPGSEFQLDQYHLRRRLSEVLGHSKLARLLGDGLVSGQWEIVERGLDLAGRLTPARVREIAELLTFDSWRLGSCGLLGIGAANAAAVVAQSALRAECVVIRCSK